jgi:hypothetical protein
LGHAPHPAVRRRRPPRGLSLNAALLKLVIVVARRLGPAAAAALLAAGRSWLADPANEDKKQQLVAQLRGVSVAVGGAAGRSAGAFARQLERRRRSVRAWRRETAALRAEIGTHPTGEVRAAALDAYLVQLAAAPLLLVGRPKPSEVRRRVLAALDEEARALPSEPLGPDERRRVSEAMDRARADCYRITRDAVPHA